MNIMQNNNFTKSLIFVTIVVVGVFGIVAFTNAETIACQSHTFSNSDIYFGSDSKVPTISCSAGTCDGGYYPDQATANKVCQKKGYAGASSFTTQSNFFTSCYDNYMWKWNGSSSENVAACTMNTGLDTVTCYKNCTVACSSASNCGTSGYTGSAFCQNGDVYQNYITYTCSNAGTTNSKCSNTTTAKLKTNCSANQTCSNGTCVDQTITCSSNSQCGTSGYTGDAFCQNGDVYKAYKTYTCNNAGTATSYCSNATANKLVTNCSANQTCSNGTCVDQTITCSSNSQCGTSGYTGDAFCSGGDVYKTYKTYTCNNAGTTSSYCSNSSADKLVTNCSSSQTCSNGTCVDEDITCDSSSDCGTSGYTGDAFCQNGDVYKAYKTYTCNNAGTTSSYCSNATANKLVTNCSSSQTCSNGTCVDQDIECSSTSDCGTSGYTGDAFCSGGDVYKAYRTYTCNNAGTTSSYCSNATANKLITNCSANQTCSNGTCNDQDIACDSSSDCGTSGYTGSAFCSGGDVYKTYRTYTCYNAGLTNSYCGSSTLDKLITNCSGSQTCSNGSCDNSCTDYSYKQCSGNYLYWYDSCGNQGNLVQYCSNGCYNNSCSDSNNLSVQTYSASNINNNQATLNGYVYGYNSYNNNYYSNNNYVWFQWGTSTNYGNETNHQTLNSSGAFSQIVNLNSYNSYNTTYHYRAVAQSTNGNVVYGSDITFTTGTTNNGSLNVTKTVRNLSNGSTGFSTSTYASPSDVLMYMITIQANNNQDISNIYVRDTLPANLIYKNNLIVSGSSNYSGDIISGMNFGTISNGQTVTITYQAQAASAENFSYGATTLVNSTSVTGSNLTNNPISSASVIVTRSAVYGISTISTGLTNNFLTDSFFLPLMIALAGILLLKSGMFFKVEKWIDSQKQKTKNYRTEKELNSRISKIQELEKSQN